MTALEPVASLREAGRAQVEEATWVDGLGEATSLPDASHDAVASAFASMLYPPEASVAEWSRVVTPGGVLAMTTWNSRGFLADMTRVMMEAVSDAPYALPPHLAWGEADTARANLEPHFENIEVSTHDLGWSFETVDAGMEYYETGSPTHAFLLKAAGPRRERLHEALRTPLLDNTASDGSVRATASYPLITARKAR